MKLFLTISVLLTLSGCASTGMYSAGEDKNNTKFMSADSRYSIPRQIRYSYTVQNTTGALLSKAEFWTYGPVRHTSTQHVVKIAASHPFELKTDEQGNQILYFQFDNLPPYSAKIVSVQADLFMSEEVNAVANANAGEFTAPARYVESDNADITALAKKIGANSPIDNAKSIFDWVAANIRSENYIPDDRGALYALTHKQGDCTEFMYLFVALNRANNIPARGVGGYVYANNAVLNAVDYHNWAEFYAQGAWHLADAQKKVFMQKSSHYIAMRIISDSTTNALGDSHRFAYGGAGLQVTMN